MLAAALTAPGKIELEERPPLRPAPGEAVLDVALAGVCGTDLALYSGDYPVPLPLVPGHEFVGRVAAVADDVDQALVGRRATAEINNTCLARGFEPLCPLCAAGLETHCRERTVTGIVGHDGAFAGQVRVPAANLHRVPDGVSDIEAVFIEPLAAALETFEMAPLAAGETVVVLGVGRLGYLIAGVAKALGARVLAVARSEEKCARAREWLGVEAWRLESQDALVERVRDWASPGAHHVVETTGSGDAAVLALAARLVRPRGTIHLKSTPGAFTPGVPLTDLVVNEVRLQGSRCGPFDKAIALLTKRPFPVAELVAEEAPLEEAGRAIPRAREVSKVVLRCAP